MRMTNALLDINTNMYTKTLSKIDSSSRKRDKNRDTESRQIIKRNSDRK